MYLDRGRVQASKDQSTAYKLAERSEIAPRQKETDSARVLGDARPGDARLQTCGFFGGRSAAVKQHLDPVANPYSTPR